MATPLIFADARPGRRAELRRSLAWSTSRRVVLFERLDFLYVPSRDVAADVRSFVGLLGARLVFAIEAMGTRVAMLELGSEPPAVLLAGHLAGERPVLVYRVADLDRALAELQERGWEPQPRFEIPHGPCCSLVLPGGHRVALYEPTRPRATEHFAGRRDWDLD